MAATTYSSNPHSTTNPPSTGTLTPHATALSVDGSPRSRGPLSGVANATSAHWTDIVRGAASEVSSGNLTIGVPSTVSPTEVTSVSAVANEQSCVADEAGPLSVSSVVEAQPESSDCDNGNGAKKLVWNKPSNESVESGPVMGAVSWPALSESTKASPKLCPSDSMKIQPDVSIASSQISGDLTPSSQSPATSSSAAQKQGTGNANASSTHNHGRPGRQRSMKRDGGGTAPANGGFPSHPGPVGDLPHNSSARHGSAGVDGSARDHPHNSAHRETGQRSNGDYPHQRNSFKRGNGGQHSRGEGSYQHYGGRRDQDRGNHDWGHRNYNGRDGHLQPPRGVPRGFIRRPPPATATYVTGPLGPYVPPYGYHELRPIYYMPPPDMPYPGPMSPVYFPAPVPDGLDPQLRAQLVNQIEYYFSTENLIKDTFLRANMDDNGWVIAALIAGFNKVRVPIKGKGENHSYMAVLQSSPLLARKFVKVTKLTNGRRDTEQVILDALRASNVVEVQGDKIRRRDDWQRWIMPPAMRVVPSSHSFSRGQDVLASGIQNMALDHRSGDADALSRSSSGDASGHMLSPHYGNSSSGF